MLRRCAGTALPSASVCAVEDDGPGVGRLESGDDAQQRGLARARGADDRRRDAAPGTSGRRAAPGCAEGLVTCRWSDGCPAVGARSRPAVTGRALQGDGHRPAACLRLRCRAGTVMGSESRISMQRIGRGRRVVDLAGERPEPVASVRDAVGGQQQRGGQLVGDAQEHQRGAGCGAGRGQRAGSPGGTSAAAGGRATARASSSSSGACAMPARRLTSARGRNSST